MTKLANPGRRSTEEWIGKTPDSPAPPHVRARVFDRAHGICHISGRRIAAGEPWELEHVVRINDGGENRESNLAPALVDKHRRKTSQENKAGAIGAGMRQSHIGAKAASKNPIRSQGFAKRVKEPKPAVETAAGAVEIARRFTRSDRR